MKRIVLLKATQFNSDFYIGICDPRTLVRIADSEALIDNGNVPEAQRPLDRKHLQEISEYVGKKDKGLLPSTIIISTKDRRKLAVQVDNSGSMPQYYIEFPETDSEFVDYKNSIDVIDGQHRLFSFYTDFIDPNIKTTDTYLMPFSLFETPMLDQRRSLFTVTNEKQKPVSPNLLLYLKEKLNLLEGDEKKYYPLVLNLNNQPMSPLHGRIVMSSEKITKGFKSKEVLKICKIAKLEASANRTGYPLDSEEFLSILSEYLEGWEAYYGFQFDTPTSNNTYTKISGFRYIMLMFDTFLELFVQASNVQSDLEFNSAYVKNQIARFEKMKMEIAGDKWKTDDTVFSCEAFSLSFRGEGATVKMAQGDAIAFRSYKPNKSGVNPFARRS